MAFCAPDTTWSKMETPGRILIPSVLIASNCDTCDTLGQGRYSQPFIFRTVGNPEVIAKGEPSVPKSVVAARRQVVVTRAGVRNERNRAVR